MTYIDIKNLAHVYAYLSALFGGNEKQMDLWWTHYNHHLKSIPEYLSRDSAGIEKLRVYTGGMTQH